MSIESEKFGSLNEARKSALNNVLNAVSSLNKFADVAMYQQAYMHKNPDDNGADTLIPIIKPDFLAAAASFNEVAAKMMAMQAVEAGTLSVDDFIAQFNLNLSEYSDGLL